MSEATIIAPIDGDIGLIGITGGLDSNKDFEFYVNGFVGDGSVVDMKDREYQGYEVTFHLTGRVKLRPVPRELPNCLLLPLFFRKDPRLLLMSIPQLLLLLLQASRDIPLAKTSLH